jgi:hypothetical protein
MNLVSSGNGPMVKCPWCLTRFHRDTVAELHSCPVCRVAWRKRWYPRDPSKLYFLCGSCTHQFIAHNANDLHHHFTRHHTGGPLSLDA